MRTRVRWKIPVLVLFLLLWAIPQTGWFDFGASSVALAQDKSLLWERFDVDIEVQPDGTFDVAEHQQIRFTEGTFTFGFRDIPKTNLRYIDNWAITDDSGNIYTLTSGGAEPYTFTVTDNGGSYVINWYFPPISNAAERYTLSYTVHGGLRYYEGGDQLWWKAIYANRSFPVLNGQVRVIVPQSANIQEWAAYINGGDARGRVTAEIIENGQAAIFALTEQLGSGRDLEVRVEFTPNVVDGAVQPWQDRADRMAAEREAEIAFRNRWGPIATLGLSALAILLIFGGPAALYALWYKVGRDKPVEMVADYLPEPPGTLPPGMAGTLLDETVDMEDIIATLVDLARRKVISITEDREEGLFRNSHDFIYRRERDDVELQAYERSLISALFGKKDEVRLSDLKNKFYNKVDGIKGKMYDAVVEAGYFPRNPHSVRNQYGCLGVGLLILAFFVGILVGNIFADLTSVGFLPGFGIGVTAIALIILGRHMPRKTDQGAEEAARWQAFKNYLKNIDKYSDLDEQKEIWDRWLPYAIAFGVDKEYIRQFERVDAPAPGWYIPSPTLYGPYRRWYYGGNGDFFPTSGGGGIGGGRSGGSMGGGLSDMSRGMGTGLTAMSAGLGTMLSSASSTMTSRPSSSSSGGGWSGGGGFSGGGSFGGGGGGGGGGGFG